MDWKAIEEIVHSAGAILLEGSKNISKEKIHRKQGAANFVTDYDTAIQRYLIDAFREIAPGASFYGEEETEGSSHEIKAGYTFYIDPIDGTTNYLFGYDHSCVSVGIALDGKIVAGFVYNPFRDEMYSAVRGEGSRLNGKRINVRDGGLGDGIAAFGCARYNCEQTETQFAVVKELFLQSLSIREGGSAALDLCRIASGANVAYFEILLQPYDYAAASIILEEAGGEIGQGDGSPVSLDAPCMVIAGTKQAAEEVRQIVREAERNQ